MEKLEIFHEEMPIMIESKAVFLDTNVLIYHTFADYDIEKYSISRELLSKLSERGCWFIISHQIIREFFAISTNSNILVNPLLPEEAFEKIDEFLQQFDFVLESENSISNLKNLSIKYQITRQKIHDANIVATMIDNDIEHLFTFNIKDFKKYNEIKLVNMDDYKDNTIINS